MPLLDLPDELLAAIPQFIRNIEDFNNARSSCRQLRRVFDDTSPKTILRLAAASAPIFFSPHPHFLITATARQVSDWAIGNDERTRTLRQHFEGGIDSLFQLCLEKASLSLSQIRTLHLARFDFLNPLADRIDKMAGQQWYQTPDFWDGGASEAFTIDCKPATCAFQYLIYGEMFNSSMAAFLQPSRNLPSFDLDVRLDYIKYCVPDWVCRNGYPGLEVKPVGPYAPGHEDELPADQNALQFVLLSGRWQRLWAPLLQSIAPDFDADWRQQLWWNAVVQTQGLRAPKALFQGPTPDDRKWLMDIRAQVEALTADDIPRQHQVGERNPLAVSAAPDFATEAHVCMRGLWSGA